MSVAFRLIGHMMRSPVPMGLRLPIRLPVLPRMAGMTSIMRFPEPTRGYQFRAAKFSRRINGNEIAKDKTNFMNKVVLAAGAILTFMVMQKSPDETSKQMQRSQDAIFRFRMFLEPLLDVDIKINNTPFAPEVQQAALKLKQILQDPQLSEETLLKAMRAVHNQHEVAMCLMYEKDCRQRVLALAQSSDGVALSDFFIKNVCNIVSFTLHHDLLVVLARDFVKTVMTQEVDDKGNAERAMTLWKWFNFGNILAAVKKENILAKELDKLGVLHELCLNDRFAALKATPSLFSPYPYVYSFIQQLGREEILIEMFKLHLKKEKDLPKDFFSHIASLQKNSKTGKHFSQQIVDCFVSSMEIKCYAKQCNDFGFASLIAMARGYPHFEKWTWQAAAFEMFKATGVFFDDTNALAWALYFDIPIKDSVVKQGSDIPTRTWVKLFNSIENQMQCQEAFWVLYPFIVGGDFYQQNSETLYHVMQHHPYSKQIVHECARRLSHEFNKFVDKKYNGVNLPEIYNLLPWCNQETVGIQTEFLQNFLLQARFGHPLNPGIENFFAYYSIKSENSIFGVVTVGDRAAFLNRLLKMMTEEEKARLVQATQQSNRFLEDILRTAVVTEQPLDGFKELVEAMSQGQDRRQFIEQKIKEIQKDWKESQKDWVNLSDLLDETNY